MGDPVNRQQLKNILVPAAAVAAVILVVGLILRGGDGGPPADPLKDPAKPPPAPDKAVLRTAVTDGSDAGMSDTRPPIDAPEWKASDAGGGLRFWDVADGTGEMLRPGQTVTCHYTGWLTDGTIFDSSRRRGEPATFSLTGVIQGWTKGLPGMKAGGIRRLYVPYPMAYGERGTNGIPPRSDLIFEVKLISAR
jgi:hypothetical protein